VLKYKSVGWQKYRAEIILTTFPLVYIHVSFDDYYLLDVQMKHKPETPAASVLPKAASTKYDAINKTKEPSTKTDKSPKYNIKPGMSTRTIVKLIFRSCGSQ
jgi:hypothetical protein